MSNLTVKEKAKRYDLRKLRDKRETTRLENITDAFWMGGSAMGSAGLSEYLLTKFPRLRHFDTKDEEDGSPPKVPTSPIVGGAAFVAGAVFESPILAGAGLGPMVMWFGNLIAQQKWSQPKP